MTSDSERYERLLKEAKRISETEPLASHEHPEEEAAELQAMRERQKRDDIEREHHRNRSREYLVQAIMDVTNSAIRAQELDKDKMIGLVVEREHEEDHTVLGGIRRLIQGEHHNDGFTGDAWIVQSEAYENSSTSYPTGPHSDEQPQRIDGETKLRGTGITADGQLFAFTGAQDSIPRVIDVNNCKFGDVSEITLPHNDELSPVLPEEASDHYLVELWQGGLQQLKKQE